MEEEEILQTLFMSSTCLVKREPTLFTRDINNYAYLWQLYTKDWVGYGSDADRKFVNNRFILAIQTSYITTFIILSRL